MLMLMFMVKCEKVGSENLASESIELVLSNVLMLMFMGKSEKVVSEKLTSEFIEQVTVMLMLTFTVKVRVMKCHESQGFICGKTWPKSENIPTLQFNVRFVCMFSQCGDCIPFTFDQESKMVDTMTMTMQCNDDENERNHKFDQDGRH